MMDIWKPLNLEHIRTNLGNNDVTHEQMGRYIKWYVPSCKYHPYVPETRVWEWEKGNSRSIPKYVFYAYGALLVDDWAEDRHEVDAKHIPEVDEFYAGLLHPGFGEVMKTEHQIRLSCDPGKLALLDNILAIRAGWEDLYKMMLGLDMRHVWVEKLEDLFPE